MGGPMAQNIIRKGSKVSVYDVVTEKMDPVVKVGGTPGNSLKDTIKNAEIVITMLPSTENVKSVITDNEGVLSIAKPNTIILDMSTIAPTGTDEVYEKCKEKNVSFIDAPVGRLVSHAISGDSLFMVGCDNGSGTNKIDLCVNVGAASGGGTDNLNAATPALRVHGNGNVGIHGVTSPQADLHVGHGGQEWRTSHGGNNLYTTNTSWGGDLTGDPNFYYGAPSGILVTSTDSSTTGPTYPGLTLYNNDNTAGGWSPMLIFAKAESGSSPYKASMAAIYARAPLGTGNGDSWIDGELWFGTSGAATNGVRGRMVLEKEGHLRPASDNTYDLGTTSYRWRNVYTTDLHLSNKVPEGTVGTDGEAIDAGNDVDGTTGDWTIQEGAEDLYIINNS